MVRPVDRYLLGALDLAMKPTDRYRLGALDLDVSILRHWSPTKYVNYLMSLWSNNERPSILKRFKQKECRVLVQEWVRWNFDVIYIRDISSSSPYIADLTARRYRALVYRQ